MNGPSNLASLGELKEDIEAGRVSFVIAFDDEGRMRLFADGEVEIREGYRVDSIATHVESLHSISAATCRGSHYILIQSGGTTYKKFLPAPHPA